MQTNGKDGKKEERANLLLLTDWIFLFCPSFLVSLQSQVDDYLTFKEVFNGFIGKCVALHTYPSAKTALEFLDVDHCGNISWKEFLFRVAWTLQEFEKEIYTVDDILHFMFEKLIFREVAPSIEEEDVVLKEITNSLRSLADTKRDLSDFEEADLGIVI